MIKVTIPKDLQEAAEFLAELGPEHVGQRIPDSVSPRMWLQVQSTVAVFRIYATIDGKRAPRNLGRLGEITLTQARALAAAIAGQGFVFTSRADFAHIIKKVEATVAECPSVLQVFNAAFAGRIERRRVKEKTVRNYRSALEKAGEKFYSSPLPSIGPILLRNTAKKVHAAAGADGFARFRIAMYWSYEYALANNLHGIEHNLADDLKELRLREETPEVTRDSLTWEQLRVFWGWLCDPRCPLTEMEIKLYKTILLVGERVDSLCHAEWSEIGEDEWWVIRPEKRKCQVKLVDSTDELFIYVTEFLRDILGRPDGSSRYVFPAKSNPEKPCSADNLPLWAAFRARDFVWLENPERAHLVPAKRAETARKYVEMRYTRFPLPDELPRFCHHEVGRHTLSTLTQEAGIPGAVLSKMLGHADERKLPGSPDIKEARGKDVERPTAIPRVMLRRAEAEQCAASVTRSYYTHLAPKMPAIRAGWLAWTAEFCKHVIGEVPQSVAEALDEIRGDDDRLLDLLYKQFGSWDAALEAITQHNDGLPAGGGRAVNAVTATFAKKVRRRGEVI